MARKKKVEKSAFSASDFRVAAATTGSVVVSGVTGSTTVGQSRDYTATVNTLVSEQSASLNVVLDNVVEAAGHTLSIPTTMPVTLTPATQEVVADAEVTTITPATSGFTAGATLTLIGGNTSVKVDTLRINVSADAYVVNDTAATASGIITADGTAVSGTIDYDTGAWTVDFTNESIELTDGTALSAFYTYQYPYENISTSVTVRHVISDSGEAGTTASGSLSALVVDPTGSTVLTSSIFTLTGTGDARMEPFAPTSIEWRGRMIDEGLI